MNYFKSALTTSLITYSIIYASCFLVPSLSAWSFLNFGKSEKQIEQEKQAIERKQPSVTLMIDPAGDAKIPGRAIDESFERALTLRCAQEIKANLEATHTVRVLLSRFPGETIDALQNASFANRMHVTLYMSLHLYKSKESPHRTFIYYYAANPAADLPVKRPKDLVFYPYNQAYKLNLKESKHYAQELYTALKQNEKKYQLACYPPLGIPLKPLIGILAPALSCEIGIDTKEDIKQCISALTDALGTLISSIA